MIQELVLAFGLLAIGLIFGADKVLIRIVENARGVRIFSSPKIQTRFISSDFYPKNILIANWVVERALKEGIPVNMMKLQAVMYFAHAYSLISTTKPFVGGAFIGYKEGVFVDDVLHYCLDHRGDFYSPILTKTKITACSYEGKWNFSEHDHKAEIEILEKVWKMFRHYDGMVLQRETKAPFSPWHRRSKDEISNEHIKYFYHNKFEAIDKEAA